MFVVGMVAALFFTGSLYLAYLSWNLSTSRRAQILATVLGSLGTLLLAGATFYNVLQTNRSLEIREKEREKPLAEDELSHVIQPAIDALDVNLREFEESDNSGCVFEWVYISSASPYGPGRAPASIRVSSLIPAGRLANEDDGLYESVVAHDRYVEMIGEQAGQLHAELEPEIERLFAEMDITGESTKAVTLSVLQELDEWGENEVMTEFWEANRDHLIRYAEEEIEVTLSEVQSLEEWYQEYMEDTYRALYERKAELMREYSISEDDITSEGDPAADLG